CEAVIDDFSSISAKSTAPDRNRGNRYQYDDKCSNADIYQFPLWEFRRHHRGHLDVGLPQDLVDLQRRITDMGHAVFALLLQAAMKQRNNGRRRSSGQQSPVGIGFDDGRNYVRPAVALKNELSRQHFIQKTAERPNIGLLVRHKTASLLGTHI